MSFSNTNLLQKLLGKWGFEGNHDYVARYLGDNYDNFDLTIRQSKKWLKRVIKNESIDFEEYVAESNDTYIENKPPAVNAQLNKYLSRWGFENQYSYGVAYLEENSELDLSEKDDRRTFKKYLKNNAKSIEIQEAPEAAEAETSEAPVAAEAAEAETSEAPVAAEAAEAETSEAPVADEAPAAETLVNPAPFVDQAAVSIFGTDKNSNDLGEFFPEEDGKVSSRMEKLFARLIEIVQDKPFYVEYGDYTDPNSGLFEIKDPVTSPDGKFVFDGSGSREFKGGRLTGKGLNVDDPNYQGIASENWAKSDSSLIRLSDAEWGKVVTEEGLVEQVGRPKGYQGELYGVNNVSTFIDSYDSLTDSTTGALTNTRKISNILGIDEPSPANDNDLDYSILHMAFGQYTDHNMSFLARTSTGQGLASQVDPFDLPAPLFPPSGPPSEGANLQEGETDTLNLDFTQQPLNSSRNNIGQLDIGTRKIGIPPGSEFTNATIQSALDPNETVFSSEDSGSDFITVNAGTIELDVFGLLQSLNDNGKTPASDMVFNFEDPTSQLAINIIPETGIIGGRGELYVVSDGQLVPVAYFDAENNNDKLAGFYEFDVNADNSVTAKGDLLLTNDADNRNEIVHRNRTEALIQNNQLYGATDLQHYYMRESARYNEEDGDSVVYRDEIGNVYRKEKGNDVKIGDIVRGEVQKNGVGFTIKNFKISSGIDGNGDPIREQLFIEDSEVPADILKTSHMLTSVAVGTDGLKSLPTYTDLLLNNGVVPQLIKNIFAADSEDQYYIGQFGPTNQLWLALSADENFIDFSNVEGYPIIGDASPRIFAPDRTSGAMRGLDQNDDGIADAFAILKQEDSDLTVRDFNGNVIDDLTEHKQPKINAEDWGMGLLLSHVVGGDWRTNENAGLTTLHTLWAREHSFHVDWINSTVNVLKNNQEEKLEFNDDYNLDLDSVTTENVSQMARRMVEMEYQKILYEQFAPSLVGDIAKIGDHGWDGYNPIVDPSVAEEFSNGAYRYGHSQIQELLTPGSELFDLFLAPQFAQSFGFSGIINGMTQITAAEVDTKVSESVRSNLLALNLDLKAANINRTRETGQANAQQLLKSLSGLDEDGVLQVDSEGDLLTEYRPLNLKNGSDVTHGILGPDGKFGTDDDTPGLDYGFVGNRGLKPFKNWEDFRSRLRGDTAAERNELLAGFMGVYDDSLEGDTVEARLSSANAKIADGDSLGSEGLDQVDVWNFMLAEKPSGDHLLGDLASAIVWEQLDRFQDGDAAYYLNSLDGLGGGVWNHTLSPLEDIIARNSTRSTSDNYIDSGFSEDVFKTTPVQAVLTDAITGIFTEAQPFNPDSINNVDYLNGFVPGKGEAVRFNVAADIDGDNPYILDPNNAIYERVGANFANIATLWENTPIDPWRANNQFAHNTSASIDDGVIGQGGFSSIV